MNKKPLGDICRFEYGKSLPEKSRISGNVNVYGSNGMVGTHSISYTNGRTLVIGRKGSIGEIHISDDSCWPIDTTYFIDKTCTSCDLDWLMLILKYLKLGELNKASGVPGLNRDDAYRQVVFNPETPEKQRQIATRLKAQLAEVEKARNAAEIQLQESAALKLKSLEKIFNGIEERAVIGSVAMVQSGYAFKSERFQANGVRLLRNTNIIPGKVYWSDTVCLEDSMLQKYPNYILFNGDVLISLDRPIISSGIKVARVSQDDLPALLVQRVGRVQINKKKLDPDYLYAYMQTEMFISKISGHDQSLGVPHISPTQVEGIEIPLPDLPTQKKLSAKLKAVASECAKANAALKRQLKDLSILPQKILAHAFER